MYRSALSNIPGANQTKVSWDQRWSPNLVDHDQEAPYAHGDRKFGIVFFSGCSNPILIPGAQGEPVPRAFLSGLSRLENYTFLMLVIHGE